MSRYKSKIFRFRSIAMPIQKKARRSSNDLEIQLKNQRRSVDFDTFDIHIQQLLDMLRRKQIKVSPKYQRQFRWDEGRCSQFIESLLLGIPIPSLFMATNPDNTWEVVDGVQRLSTIIKFAAEDDLRKRHAVGPPLVLTGLQKLTGFEGFAFEALPLGLQLHFSTRPIKVITLNDKSDRVVRYDLFERLNKGGVNLSPQEIRDCVFQGDFADFLERLGQTPAFKRVVSLTPEQQRNATAEECVLRFFAFRDRYKLFEHSVTEFLNGYMETSSKGFEYQKQEAIFQRTFNELARIFPKGIARHNRKKTTPLILFEGIAVGASFALDSKPQLNGDDLQAWIDCEELRKTTTGFTNDRSAVKGRIEFCRDRFLGKPHVPGHKN